MGTTLEVATHIASLPPLATRMTKESLLRGLDIPNLSDASLVDLYRFMALEQTEDKTKATQHGARSASRCFAGASADRKAAGSERQGVADGLSRFPPKVW